MNTYTEHNSPEEAIAYCAEHNDELFPEAKELTITGTLSCPMCRSKAWIIMPAEWVDAFLSGAFAQDAFPNMTSSQRERFITGICPSCWGKMFAR